MVAVHPRKPGRFVLAIECDGATYHSSHTARDRDRLRQQQLENLGWRFHRIWSTDWFLRKDSEVKRAIQALEAAVEHADKLDAGPMPNEDSVEAGPEKSTTNGSDGSVKKRGPRPPIPERQSITHYAPYELMQLIQWVTSDGQLRTDDEIVTEMVTVLGFSRRGAKIEAAIRDALKMYRAVINRQSS